MTPDLALKALRKHAVEGKALQMAAYHKSNRPYFGVAVPAIDAEVKIWRAALDIDGRIALADGLWKSNVHEARIAAAKLLMQARIDPDQAVWDVIKAWVPTFDAFAISDHACTAGSKRLAADPSRLDEVEEWSKSARIWTRRAALMITLPWTKKNNPKPADLAVRERVLGWAAGYVDDPNKYIQMAISGWLRDLSKHDPDRTRAFIDTYGERMKPYARKDAVRLMKQQPTL